MCDVPETQILLETDAPYFKQMKTRISIPGELADAAEGVAKIRGTTAEKIMEVATANALLVFRVHP